MIKYNNGAFVVEGFLTQKECSDLISRSEGIGYTRSKIQTSSGEEESISVRNNERILFDDYDLAKQLFDRLLQYLPQEIDAWKPSGLNKKFRFYRYGGDQYFKWHVDGSFKRDYFEVSKLTALLYLNGDFEAGETEFEGIKIQPEPGLLLVFPHKLRHQGVPPKNGIKYVLRTDVMYAKA
ncbi:2OG-Fe(II) oxygenase [Halioxenophilus aromaticivorans]|uniref:Fe2OG dioxygenase domain-containing protein n=1 Tax=Halioxenophilus aromaticivorans TaxID=1306992 RepID=A0AAV3U2T5_9ALTE